MNQLVLLEEIQYAISKGVFIPRTCERNKNHVIITLWGGELILDTSDSTWFYSDTSGG